MTMNDSSFKPGHIPPESEDNPDLLVHTVLFEQYRLLLVKQTAILILNRVMSFLIIAFVAISTHLSLLQLLAAVLVSIVIMTTWFYERRLLSNQAQALAYDLAQQSGSKGLNFYIQSQYHANPKASSPLLYSYEPLLWLALTIVLALFQYLFGTLLLH